MKMEELLITPEMAETWLSKNPSNRTISKAWVDALARDMEAGEWDLNGESIKFNGDEALTDGQHRLAACVQSGVAFRSVVITGVGNKRNIDNVRKRTFTDKLRIAGVKHYTSMSSALRTVGSYHFLGRVEPYVRSRCRAGEGLRRVGGCSPERG